ncbi:MAG: hypothetical protein AAFQ94_31695, partial [Bacteroidota bacterium]
MEKYQFSRRKKLLVTILMILVSVTINTPLRAQQDRSTLIYGTIETIDNTYKGYIRWGKEEVFW